MLAADMKDTDCPQHEKFADFLSCVACFFFSQLHVVSESWKQPCIVFHPQQNVVRFVKSDEIYMSTSH